MVGEEVCVQDVLHHLVSFSQPDPTYFCFHFTACSHSFFQLMVNSWFGARWFGIRIP